MAIHLKPFDPQRDFIVHVDMLCRGRAYRRGEAFEKTTVPHRTLRILYEGRSIGYPEDFKPVVPVRAAAPSFDPMRMDRKALIAELDRRKVTVDKRWNKNRLAEEVARFAHAVNG